MISLPPSLLSLGVCLAVYTDRFGLSVYGCLQMSRFGLSVYGCLQMTFVFLWCVSVAAGLKPVESAWSKSESCSGMLEIVGKVG